MRNSRDIINSLPPERQEKISKRAKELIPEEVVIIAEALAGFYQVGDEESFHPAAWAIYNKLCKPRSNLRSVL